MSAATRKLPEFPREIMPGIHWLGFCNATDMFGGTIHVHTAPYVIVGPEASLMVDTGSPVQWSWNFTGKLDQVLNGRRLDWVFPTHSEVPHCGNLRRIVERYPEVRIAGDVRDYQLHFPDLVDHFHPLAPGDALELGGSSRFIALPGLIKDLPTTLWGYETSQQVLFPGDGFAYSHHPVVEFDGDSSEDYHVPGECALLASEFDYQPSAEQASFIIAAALYWTRYVPIAPFLDRVVELLERYPTKMIAPAHGNPIDDLDTVMPMIREAHRLAYKP
jgi:flavorubredoxin